jgi:UDP-N-acetylmuramyl pentapeptide phosphotransferase/UDP-N-acetylglucosamine-1-phosphate transferase
VRLASHALGAALAIFAFGYWHTVSLPLLGQVSLGWLGWSVTLLWIVGLTNAYNFMDGIDGLAAGQAVIGGVFWAVIGWQSGAELIAWLGMLIASASFGFLLHNWPPARIFMGDVASGFGVTELVV